MPTPGVYICIRRTLDWHDEAATAARLRPDFRPKVEVWNATLDPPYHLFRHRLKQIAQANLARVENAVRAPLEEIPRGAVVIPVDDDDWLAPDLADRLAEQYDPAASGYLWIRHVVEPPLRLRTRAWYWLWSWKASTCATNNYAIPNRPELAELVYHHSKAGRYFDANRSRIKRMPRTLSIQNRNLSSQTAMAWRRTSLTRDELVESVDRYRTLYSSRELPDELDWARPCIARMEELMRQVRVK
jgi:hypothetical protein